MEREGEAFTLMLSLALCFVATIVPKNLGNDFDAKGDGEY